MEDEIDIYDDLPSFNTNDCVKHKAEIEELSERCKNFERENAELSRKVAELAEANKTLSVNTSSLMKTAKAEISRKDRMIAELRQELDNAAFRRNGYVRPQPHKVPMKSAKGKPSKIAPEVRSTVPVAQPPLEREPVDESEDPEQKYEPEKIAGTLYGERLRKKILLEQEAERKEKEDAKLAESEKKAAASTKSAAQPTVEVAAAKDIGVEAPRQVLDGLPNMNNERDGAANKSFVAAATRSVSQSREEDDKSSNERRNKNILGKRPNNDVHVELKRRRTENSSYNGENISRYDGNPKKEIRSNFESNDDGRASRNSPSNHRQALKNRDAFDRTRQTRVERCKSNYRSRSRTPDRRNVEKRSDRHRTEKCRAFMDDYGKGRRNGSHSDNDYRDKFDNDGYRSREKFERRLGTKVGGRRSPDNRKSFKSERDYRRSGRESTSSEKGRSGGREETTGEKVVERRESRSNSSDGLTGAKIVMESAERDEGMTTRSKDAKSIVAESKNRDAEKNNDRTLRAKFEKRPNERLPSAVLLRKGSSAISEIDEIHEKTKREEAKTKSNDLGPTVAEEICRDSEVKSPTLSTTSFDKEVANDDLVSPLTVTEAPIVEFISTISNAEKATDRQSADSKTAIHENGVGQDGDMKVCESAVVKNDAELTPEIGGRSFREEKIENIEEFIQNYDDDENLHCEIAKAVNRGDENKSCYSTSSIVDTLSMDTEELGNKDNGALDISFASKEALLNSLLTPLKTNVSPLSDNETKRSSLPPFSLPDETEQPPMPSILSPEETEEPPSSLIPSPDETKQSSLPPISSSDEPKQSNPPSISSDNTGELSLPPIYSDEKEGPTSMPSPSPDAAKQPPLPPISTRDETKHSLSLPIASNETEEPPSMQIPSSNESEMPPLPPISPSNDTMQPPLPPISPSNETKQPPLPPISPPNETEQPPLPPISPSNETEQPPLPPISPSNETEQPSLPPISSPNETERSPLPPISPSNETKQPSLPLIFSPTETEPSSLPPFSPPSEKKQSALSLILPANEIKKPPSQPIPPSDEAKPLALTLIPDRNETERESSPPIPHLNDTREPILPPTPPLDETKRSLSPLPFTDQKPEIPSSPLPSPDDQNQTLLPVVSSDKTEQHLPALPISIAKQQNSSALSASHEKKCLPPLSSPDHNERTSPPLPTSNDTSKRLPPEPPFLSDEEQTLPTSLSSLNEKSKKLSPPQTNFDAENNPSSLTLKAEERESKPSSSLQLVTTERTERLSVTPFPEDKSKSITNEENNLLTSQPTVSTVKNAEIFVGNEISAIKIEPENRRADICSIKQIPRRHRIPCTPILSSYSRKRRGLVLADSTASHHIVRSDSSSEPETTVTATVETKVVNNSTKVDGITTKPTESSDTNGDPSRMSNDNSHSKILTPEKLAEAVNSSIRENVCEIKSATTKTTVESCELKKMDETPKTMPPSDSTDEIVNLKKKSEDNDGPCQPEVEFDEQKVATKTDRSDSSCEIEETKPLETRGTRSALKTIIPSVPVADGVVGFSNRKRALPKEKENQSKEVAKQCKIMVVARRRRPVHLEDSSTVTTLVTSTQETSGDRYSNNKSIKNYSPGGAKTILANSVAVPTTKQRKRRSADK